MVEGCETIGSYADPRTWRTVERYEPLGLKLVDYGINDIDAIVPRHRRISAQGRGLATMVEILLVSRAMMAAIGCGFLRRISRDAHAYADRRRIGADPLSVIPYVRYKLGAWTAVSSAVFDGNNDLLSQQLTQHCLTLARRNGGQPLTAFLGSWPLTAPAMTANGLPDLHFLDRDLKQEHQVVAGRTIAYLFAISQVIRWATRPVPIVVGVMLPSSSSRTTSRALLRSSGF